MVSDSDCFTSFSLLFADALQKQSRDTGVVPVACSWAIYHVVRHLTPILR